jgi:hypothetical protein
MQLPENPLIGTFKTVGTVALKLVGLLAGLYLFILLVLILIGPNAPLELSTAPAWTTTTEVHLRNRTATPLQVMFTVARPALHPDTIIWGVDLSPQALGVALVQVDSLVIEDLRYPLAAPLLLPGTADTVVIAGYAGSLPPAPRQRRRFNIHANQSNPTRLRSFNAAPIFDPTVRVQRVPGQPDSLRLTLLLAPDSTVRVGRRKIAYYPGEGSRFPVIEGDNVPSETPYRPTYEVSSPPPAYYPLAMRVQWRDAQGRWQQQRPPVAALMQLPAAELVLPGAGYQLVRRYWDYH